MEESTHVYFDGNAMYISPDLVGFLKFLQGMEEEVNGLLGHEEQLIKIKEEYKKILQLIKELSQNVKTNDPNARFKSSFDLSILKNLQHTYIPRSEMIVLFANLETLLQLFVIYEHETDDEKTLIKLVHNEALNFIKKFILTEKNSYYKENLSDLGRIQPSNLRELRNFLTHFFSVRGLVLIPHQLRGKARELEKALEYKVQFISPQDLYGLIKSAGVLLLSTWSSDLFNRPDKFKRAIVFVKAIIEAEAPIVVSEKKLKL